MDKTLKTHKLSKDNLLDGMYNYFRNLFHDKLISADETFNFLKYYIEYIFRANGLNSQDYIINIHGCSDREFIDFAAYMTRGQRPNEFDIYINRDMMYSARLIDSSIIAKLIIIFGHEAKHCIQYINKDKKVLDYSIKGERIEQLLNKCSNRLKTKKKYVSKRRLAEDLDMLHVSERDADKEGFERFLALIDELTEYCKEDQSTMENLSDMKIHAQEVLVSREKFVKDTKKDYKKLKKQFARYGELIDILDY